MYGKQLKWQSNLPTKATNPNCHLNANESNEYFAHIGPKIQAEVNQDNRDDNDFQSYLDNTDVEEPPYLLEGFSEILETEILEFISTIAADKSTNDPIPLRIFKQILPSFIAPFTHIINLSLRTGVMPASCKIAIVTPIHKSGSLEDPGNYRPISILPILSKTIENFVNSQLTQYLDDRGLLVQNQYGFRKNHSTTYLMLDLFDRIYTARSKQKHPGIIFLDIKKAFDSVHHSTLLSKLKHYGISGLAFKWFESYLSGRRQQTRVGSRISNFY